MPTCLVVLLIDGFLTNPSKGVLVTISGLIPPPPPDPPKPPGPGTIGSVPDTFGAAVP